MIHVVYVDHIIFTGPDSNAIDVVITGLGVQMKNNDTRLDYVINMNWEIFWE